MSTRGSRSKTRLTSRPPSGTGHRKGAKHHSPEATSKTPSKLRPTPRATNPTSRAAQLAKEHKNSTHAAQADTEPELEESDPIPDTYKWPAGTPAYWASNEKNHHSSSDNESGDGEGGMEEQEGHEDIEEEQEDEDEEDQLDSESAEAEGASRYRIFLIQRVK